MVKVAITTPSIALLVMECKHNLLFHLKLRREYREETCVICKSEVTPTRERYLLAAFRFAQDAFIFTDRAFFCAADMGLRFRAKGGATATFAVLPDAFRFAAQKAFIRAACRFR
jgi:hypothetical protein